jgi:transcriptional regulator with XRE-family HTH domain
MKARLTLETLGPALRLLRHMRKLRQQTLAERAKVTLSMVSAFENSNRYPSLRSLARILDALDAGLYDLGRAVERVEEAHR